MIALRPRSLQARLAWQLIALYLVASLAGVGMLVYRANAGITGLTHRELRTRAEALAAVVRPVAANTRQPAPGAGPDANAGMAEAFVVRDAAGRVVAASAPDFASQAGLQRARGSAPLYYRLPSSGTPFDNYCVATLVADTAAGPLEVTVARSANAVGLADLLDDITGDVAWIVPLLMALTLGTVLLAVRRSMAPISAISSMASAIGPHATEVRLPTAGLPGEVAPLVHAVNDGLQRLEHGFEVQRDFTAHAAHELRTPLAILGLGLDAMQREGHDVGPLRADVARMHRMVEQLLAVARLDAIGLDTSAAVDLNALALDTVAALAPWAIARGRNLGLDAAPAPAHVQGNADAIRDALRNLIENAIVHAPVASEVLVSVDAASCQVRVADAGPGVPLHERERIFERFWRRADAPAGGAGLGLAIVRSVLIAHRGRVWVEERSGGGAVFSMQFPPLPRTV